VLVVGHDGDAEHLAADEVGNVYVLGGWGRHCGGGELNVVLSR
jgi:hypothetical protein